MFYGLWSVHLAVFECSAELGVCGVAVECLDHCADLVAGNCVSVRLPLGAQDSEKEGCVESCVTMSAVVQRVKQFTLFNSL